MLFFTKTENVDSSDDGRVSTTVSNEKSTALVAKEPFISIFISIRNEIIKMSNDLENFINKKIKS